MVTLYLVRHGQTEENIARIFQGHLPGTLTAEGREQAYSLGQQLQGIHFDLVISSDLRRVVDTVEIAMKGRIFTWIKTKQIREIDWGSLTGRKISDVDTSSFPPDVETREQLYARATQFVENIRSHYDGKTLLVVGHGLINRSIQASIQGISLSEIKTISVQNNAEIRMFRF